MSSSVDVTEEEKRLSQQEKELKEKAVRAKQKAWLETTLGTAIEGSTEAVKAGKQKAAGQKLIEDRLGSQRASIQAAFLEVKVDMKSGPVMEVLRKLVNKPAQMRLMDPNHDPMKDFDTWHDLPEMKSIPEDDLKLITESYKKIVETAEELRKNPYYAEPEKPEAPKEPSTPQERKDFSEALLKYDAELKEKQRRLAEDLWNPLQREGVIPESFIPDEYSEVKLTFDEANKYYEARLQDYSRELGEYGAFMEKFRTGMAIGQSLLKVATAGAGMAGAIGQLQKNADVVKNAEEAKKILGYVEVAMSSTSGIMEAALTQRDAIGVADALNQGLSTAITAAVPAPWNDVINGGIEAGIRSASAGKKFAEGKPDEGLKEFAAAIASSLGAADRTEDKKIKAIGDAIALGINKLVESKEVADAVRSGDYHAALSFVINNIGDAVPPANGAVLGWIQRADEQVGELEEGVKDISEQQKIINQYVDQEELKRRKEAAAKQQVEDYAAFMREGDRAFEEALAYGFSSPLDDDMEADQAEAKREASLKKIVAVYKRNEMVFELAKKIAVGGPAFVGDLVPGLGLVAAATQLCFSIGEAIKQSRQLLIWTENLADAQAASSAQMDAVLNRYGLQTQQVIRANIRVAIHAVKVAGEACKLAGEAAPAGYVVAAAADLAEASLDAAITVMDAAEMEKAWRDYKKALENPKDRKAIRKAMRSNPTLAKYAMAWGAVEDGNAIAQECMRRCGLNQLTLAQRETNVAQVVDYLEMVYKDDPVVLRAVPVKDDWHPGEMTVSFRGFMKFYRAAMTKADPALKSLDVSAISGGLASYDAAGEALTQAIKDALDQNLKIVEENAKADQQARLEFRQKYEEFETEQKRQLEAGETVTVKAPVFEEPEPKPMIEVAPALYQAAVTAATETMGAFASLQPMTNANPSERHESFANYCETMEAKLRIARDGFDKTWREQGWLPG
ncbi:MAG: hypothetical protein ACFBRM_04545 [Pikeienuella sp.]